jgi:hypothetical protein
VCVRRFHFHEKKGKCVYGGNQGRWFLKELLWFMVLNHVVDLFLEVNSELFTMPFWRRLETIYLLYHNSSIWWLSVSLYLICSFWLLKKFLTMVSLLYMLFTGYTYQQMMHNERYMYLYRPVAMGHGGQGNLGYQNKRIYLFDEGVKKGVRRAIGNAIRFFCG